jgi:two-component system, chemotaxis family, protein-glutamate methylesterase/glutaminase
LTGRARRTVRREVEVVAMGASTGGLVAFQTILSALPEQFPAAVLLVQHRMAEAESRLVELLQKHCRLPVVEPDDKDPIVAGSVYLAPAGYHMLVEQGWIALSTDPPVWFARPSIDVLFESVADAYGDRALAVVLTGANADGASGAAAIQNAGGRVLIEDPSGAVSPELPRAALDRLRPDAVMALPDIAPTLLRWCVSSVTRAANPKELS